MANYECRPGEETNLFMVPISIGKHPIYGSSRVGVYNRLDTLYKNNNVYNPAWYTNNKNQRNLGLKSFELSNHLGNLSDNIRLADVLVTVSDKKVYVLNGANITFEPEITTISDYYPFGSAINTRSYSSGAYRYGFNGKESDDENFEGAIAFEARIYDLRLGRFLSLDPRMSEYAWQSPYAYFKNCPIFIIDYLGEGEHYDKD